MIFVVNLFLLKLKLHENELSGEVLSPIMDVRKTTNRAMPLVTRFHKVTCW
jgi:hypothetical protein